MSPRSNAAISALLGLCLAASASADEPKAGLRDGTPSQILQKTRALVEGEESFPGQDRLRGACKALENDAEKEPPDRRDAVVQKRLDEVTAAAEGVDLERSSPETATRVNDAVSALSNSAGNWEQGRRFAERALEHDPDDRDALINRSNADFGLKRFDSAFAAADRAVKLNPADSESFTTRAMASYGLGNYLQATEDARRALALDPNDKTAFAVMKLAEGKVPALNADTLSSQLGGQVQREYHGMLQQLNQVEERRRAPLETPLPKIGQRLVRDAAAKIAVKDYWGALADANKAVAEDPASLAAYYYRAAANNLVARYQEAAQDATRGLMINPSDAALRDTRAWAFNHLRRFRDSISDSNHSLEINPQNPYAFANLSYSHEQLGDLRAMLRELKAAAEINPQFELAYKDAAARHGLEPEPLPSERFAPPKTRSPEKDEARRRSLMTILVSSIVGGILIALGLTSLASGSRKPEPRALPRLSPKIQSSYALGRVIGMGGMGVVYKGTDLALQRKVAVKVMRDELRLDEKAKRRFLEEARTVAALHHPGIVDIHSIVEDDSGIYLIFEFIAGRSIEAILSERRRLSLGEAKAVLKQVCQALDYAHRHRVVHRDLKPGNIMVSDQGLVKVMDFGISREAKECLECADSALAREAAATANGTPYYMAPEQESGAVRKESDVYSLGVCLYEMLTGQRPFPGPDSAMLKASRDYRKASDLVPNLPSEIDALIHGALHPDPDLRIRSAKDFWALLERVKDQVPA